MPVAASFRSVDAELEGAAYKPLYVHALQTNQLPCCLACTQHAYECMHDSPKLVDDMLCCICIQHVLARSCSPELVNVHGSRGDFPLEKRQQQCLAWRPCGLLVLLARLIQAACLWVAE